LRIAVRRLLIVDRLYSVYDEYSMKRWLILSLAPLSAFSLIALFLSISARASLEQQNFVPASIAPPDPIPSPTPAVFTATMEVVPNKSLGTIDDTFYVRVAIQVSIGCAYHLFDLTLKQIGEDAPIFEPDTVIVGPGIGPYTFTLRAVSPGTVTFNALAYGERDCHDYLNWAYVGGISMPVTILQHIHRVYLPGILEPR